MTTKTLLPLLVMVLSLPASSQDFQRKYMAKVNLSAFALKGLNVQLERQLTHRTTVALAYSTIPTSGIPFTSFIQRQIDDPDVAVSDFRLGTSIFTPEVRFYVGKHGAFTGFYLAPYARIGSYNISGPVKFGTTTGRRTAVFDGKWQTITGGLMIGSNFRLSERLHLDWWILGASIGGGNGDLAAITPLTKDEQTSLQKVLNELNVPLTKIRSQVGDNGATITTTGTMLGLRGLGINLGFRF